MPIFALGVVCHSIEHGLTLSHKGKIDKTKIYPALQNLTVFTTNQCFCKLTYIVAGAQESSCQWAWYARVPSVTAVPTWSCRNECSTKWSVDLQENARVASGGISYVFDENGNLGNIGPPKYDQFGAWKSGKKEVYPRERTTSYTTSYNHCLLSQGVDQRASLFEVSRITVDHQTKLSFVCGSTVSRET